MENCCLLQQTVSKFIRSFKKLHYERNRLVRSRKRIANTPRNSKIIQNTVKRNRREFIRKISLESGINREAIRRTPFQAVYAPKSSAAYRRQQVGRAPKRPETQTSVWSSSMGEHPSYGEKLCTVQQTHYSQNDSLVLRRSWHISNHWTFQKTFVCHGVRGRLRKRQDPSHFLS